MTGPGYAGTGRPVIALAALGRANLASMAAALERAGAVPMHTDDPRVVMEAEYALLPGVGAFGPVADRLRATGLDAAFRERVRLGLPTMGVCLGMQLFFRSSEESPGARGMGALPGELSRFRDVAVPQFG